MTPSNRFRLSAVVECLLSYDGTFWCALPEQPWPTWLELRAEPTEDEIALLLYVLAKYNCGEQGTQHLPPAELASSEKLVLPGGLSASLGGVTITPSCCCGLEHWRDWQTLTTERPSLWLGHDPWPFVERIDDAFVIRADGGDHGEAIGLDMAGIPSIHFDLSDLATALREVESDLVLFSGALRTYLHEHHPKHADKIADRFVSRFVQARTK